jgi:hypothetical protein
MDEWWTTEGLTSLMVIAKAKVASRKTLAADVERPKPSNLCSACGVTRCTVVCPKRTKRAIAKLLLAFTIVHFDATADPAIAHQNHALDCVRGVIYYNTPDDYREADSVGP